MTDNGADAISQYSWGPVQLAPDCTVFRIWAPDAEDGKVYLELEGLPPTPMLRRDNGWFEVTANAGAGSRYQFRVASNLAVPDPASRQQMVDVHGASVVVDSHSYEWRHPDWPGRPWHEVILYELHVGLLGGFRGVMNHLPRLRELGVTAIELMPIADFPGHRNWGYDGVLPYAPDAAYGTPDDLKALVDTAHGLGIMVFLDVVYNHFGPDGAYLHAYAKSFFVTGKATPWGAAINFRQPEVQSFFEENAIFWLNEFRFDGLRFDAVHMIDHKAWIHDLGERLRNECRGRHIHLVLENEHNTAHHLAPDGPFDAQWNDDGHNALHCLLTGEHDGYYADFAEHAAENLARILQEGFLYQGQKTPRRQLSRGEPSGHLPPTSFVLFLQNHDQIGNRAFGERLSDLIAPTGLKIATALLLLCPQIPLLFMGEEWGATARFLFFTDYRDALAKVIREGRRLEFSHFPAFRNPASLAQIPDPNDLSTFANSVPDITESGHPRHADILALHKHLLELRHREIIPRLPGARSIGAQTIGSAAVFAQWRMGDGYVLTIATNFSDTPVFCPASSAGKCLFESSPGSAEAMLTVGRLTGFVTVALLSQPIIADGDKGP